MDDRSTQSGTTHKLTAGSRVNAVTRVFDVSVAIVVLVLAAPIIALGVLVATTETGQWGIFAQERIGRFGKGFRIYKIRTMRRVTSVVTTITTANDARITPIGRMLRSTKLDELPQFINVLKGDMSIVGPRPDVAGYADKLIGDDRIVLQVRPGLTGPASLVYRDEERLLASKPDPRGFNDTVLWPAKVAINRHYVETRTFFEDIRIILDTAFPFLNLSRTVRFARRIAAEGSGQNRLHTP